MLANRQCFVRRKARHLLNDLWRRRGELGINAPNMQEFLRLAPDRTITDLLRVHLIKPEEIVRPAKRGAYMEVAGYIDRKTNTIAVAQKFRAPWRRFTTAHEIGHWMLHPSLEHHRDRPLQGGERSDS